MTEPPRPTLHDAARWLSDFYCLWRFCAKAACRRAQGCRGDPRGCVRALPLVPPEALDFLEGYEEAQRDRLSFDEMMRRCDMEWRAVEEWRSTVLATLPDGEREIAR